MTHPNGPTPEQLTEWLQQALEAHPDGKPALVGGFMAGKAWCAGADDELEEIEELLRTGFQGSLRMNRRPAPPSPREEAMATLERLSQWLNPDDVACIRRALEADN